MITNNVYIIIGNVLFIYTEHLKSFLSKNNNNITEDVKFTPIWDSKKTPYFLYLKTPNLEYSKVLFYVSGFTWREEELYYA